jgi:hypothetical protein
MDPSGRLGQARRFLAVLALVYAAAAPGRPAGAQPFGPATDPRPIVMQIIMAFQNCGPPQVYQMFGQQVFQAVWAQTGGSGCYPAIQAAGPVTNMQVTNVQMMPAGPVFALRVNHGPIAADWFIGLSNYTGRVEMLTFQDARTAMPPPVLQGPAPGPNMQTGGTLPPPPVATPPPSGPRPQGCELYPVMCQ